MEQHDKQHSIPPNVDINIENHYHNHIDTADILSQLHILKMQNKQILQILLSNEDDQDRVKALAGKLKESTDKLKAAVAQNTSL